jgi:hypothetical protein
MECELARALAGPLRSACLGVPCRASMVAARASCARNRWQLRPLCLSLPDLELRLPGADVTFLFFRMDANRSKTVRPAWQRSHGHCGTAKKNFEDKLAAASRAADAVIANIGVWYGQAALHQYRADVAFVLSRLRALATSGKLALFRESVVQHFPTVSGSGLYEERTDGGRSSKCFGQCVPLGERFAHQHDWRNSVLHEQVAAMSFPHEHVVPVAELLRPMATLHKKTKWACKLDCTHYCYHPAVWAALLDGVYRRLVRFFGDAAESGAAAGKQRTKRRAGTARAARARSSEGI